MKSSQIKRQYWQEQMVLWEASGVTQRQFCEAHQLSFSSFLYWRKAFRRGVDVEQKDVVQSTRMTTAFIPVKVIDTPQSPSHRLRSPDGWEIVLASNTTPEWLASLWHQVRAC